MIATPTRPTTETLAEQAARQELLVPCFKGDHEHCPGEYRRFYCACSVCLESGRHD